MNDYHLPHRSRDGRYRELFDLVSHKPGYVDEAMRVAKEKIGEVCLPHGVETPLQRIFKRDCLLAR